MFTSIFFQVEPQEKILKIASNFKYRFSQPSPKWVRHGVATSAELAQDSQQLGVSVSAQTVELIYVFEFFLNGFGKKRPPLFKKNSKD